MGSGYKRLYEATERENQTLTKLVDAQGEIITRLEAMVEAQKELIKTLVKQVDELQESGERQSAADHPAESKEA